VNRQAALTAILALDVRPGEIARIGLRMAAIARFRGKAVVIVVLAVGDTI
jgi:hypothetical protein